MDVFLLKYPSNKWIGISFQDLKEEVVDLNRQLESSALLVIKIEHDHHKNTIALT